VSALPIDALIALLLLAFWGRARNGDGMEFDLQFYLIAMPAAFIAGFAKGGFGGGAAFVATAILALVIAPTTALALMLPLLMLVDLFMLRPYWRQWHWPSALALMVGAVPGIALGAALFRVADADVLRILIGVVSLAFVLFQGARHLGWVPARDRPFGQGVGLLAGLVSGFTSFVSHAGGPPTAIYLLSQGLGKTAYQATTVLAYWVINACKAVPYAFLGIFSYETLKADLIMAPAALIGAFAGVYAHRVMPERWFFAVTYALLLCTGLKLIWDGTT